MAVKHVKQIVWTVVAGTVLAAGVVSSFAFSLGKYEKVKVRGDVATIAVSKLSDGKAHFHRLNDGGKEITFFAVKAADGSFKTAFDACDSCFRSKKGYEQQGDKMLCKNCNKKFAIDRLGPNATGGCNPGYLPSQVNGNILTVKVDDLKAGTHYF